MNVNCAHYRGAMGMMTPNASFAADFKSKYTAKDAAMLIGCQSGRRSQMAIDQLKAEYPNLVNVEGGFASWASGGLPVEK